MQWADKKYSRDDTGTVSSSYTFAKPEVQLPVQVYPNYNRQVNQRKKQVSNASEIQNRILRARKENLALKRAIVQKSLAQQHEFFQQQEKGQLNNLAHTNNEQSAQRSYSEIPEFSNSDFGMSATPSKSTLSSLSSEPEITRDVSKQSFASLASSASKGKALSERKKANVDIKKTEDHQSKDAISDADSMTGREAMTSDYRKKSIAKSISDNDSDSIVSKGKSRKKTRKRRDSSSTEELRKLAQHVDAAIEENKRALNGDLNSNSNLEPGKSEASIQEKSKKKAEDKKRRQELKSRIDSLLQSTVHEKKPLWRHKLKGNHNPLPEHIMKGKQLFRVVGRMVLDFYVKPMLSLQLKQQLRKHLDADALYKNILLFLDSCGIWIGRAVKLPISSIIQDNTLNFCPVERNIMRRRGRATNLQGRMLQLKVRVTSIVRGICGLELPSPHVCEFLKNLISDGNFFRDGFLFDFEQQRLEFNSIGATRNVVEPAPEQDLLSVLQSSERAQKAIFAYGGKAYKINRAKILIKNFLLTRVLVNNILLAPWHHGLCHEPKVGTSDVLFNLRMVATVMYEILAFTDEDFPNIVHVSKKKPRRKMKQSDGAQDNPKVLDPSESKDEISTPRAGGGNDKPNKVLGWLSDTLDSVMGTDYMAKDQELNQLESNLLQRRPPYDILQNIHCYLFEPEYLSAVRLVIDVWIRDLSGELDDWILKVTRHVVQLLVDAEEEKRKKFFEDGEDDINLEKN